MRFKKEASKEKIISVLKRNIGVFNRWCVLSGREPDLRYADLSYADLRSANLRYADLRSADLRYADLSSADLRYADLSYADLRSANLSSANLDFSCMNFSCKSLKTKYDNKHIIQILYHAGKPCENNHIELDADTKKLLNSKMFKKVVNKFHRTEECGIFGGTK
jgi:hypothetical protein